MLEINVSDLISVLALILSSFATWKTLRLNKSQERLNDLLTAREESEVVSARKADVSANFYKIGRGNYRFKVFNKGKAVARNVQIDFPGEKEYPVLQSDLSEKFPISLETHQSVELIVIAHMGMKRKFNVQLSWEDDNTNTNKKHLQLTI